MSLKIYYGSRLESLAAKLKERLLKDRQEEDPFTFSRVVVPNPNVAKWLQIRQFAAEPCLCAGIEFPFMEKRLTELMLEGLPEGERTRIGLIPDHAYARAIVSILQAGSDGQPEWDKLAPFRGYIAAGGGASKQAAMTWQLADKLADLMDSYDVHRPEIVEAWLGTGKCPYELPTGATAEAEAALARALWGKNGRFKPDGDQLSLRQLYNRVKNVVPNGGKTVYFFGQSTLSSLQTDILVWLARTREVVVFHYNLCREYWGDITTRKEDLKMSGLQGEDPEIGYGCDNELLKDFGIAGRETLRLLVDLEDRNGNESDTAKRVDFEWIPVDDEESKTDTVLEKVQVSVRYRSIDIGRCYQDASVQVIGTPGIRREVEMVYNSILGSVARPEGVTGERPWSACSFSDIAVIVPDMKTYRPVIESVFDARGEVPYALLDTTASEDSHYLRGFFDLIALGRDGLNRERLFNVLENPCVQLAMGFSRKDVIDWRELTAKIGAFDGFEHDGQNGYFDWSSALKRLRLARITDEISENGDTMQLAAEGGDGALKFSEIVELLYRDAHDTLLDEKGNPWMLPLFAVRQEDGSRADCWAVRLERLAKTYLEIDKDDKLEGKVRQSLIGTLHSLGEIQGQQGFELAVAAVEHFVGGIACSKGKYLTSGVTIGGFPSLSTLPFKQVYMMGMGAGGFPGRTSSSTLDIRGTGWRLGDVSAPNRNRFLFLESLMSVRDRLVISYPNRDIEKDAELFPAGIVRSVERFIGEHVLEYADGTDDNDWTFQEFKGYPLLERGEAGPRKGDERRPTDDIVWKKDDPDAGLLPTYSEAARKLALERVNGTGNRPEITDVDSKKTQPRVEISAKVLAEFLKNPVRAVMRYRFGINVVGYVETDLELDSPIGAPSGPDKWGLQAKWLDPDGKTAVEKEIRRLQYTGRMPTGFLGDFAWDELMENAEERLAAVQDFTKGFSLSDGEKYTLHLDYPAEFEIEGGGRRSVRLVAEIPNWKASDGEVLVLVTGKLDDKAATSRSPASIQELPGERCLESFIAYLMHLVQSGSDGLSLCVGVVDLDDGKTGTWRWTVDCKSARAYLETLVKTYLTYEKSGDGKMVDFTCKKLLGALNGEYLTKTGVWDEILEKLTAEDYDHPSGSFNNHLVIEQNLASFKREPETGEELKKIYDERYKLTLSGSRLEAAGKEADHE